MLDLSAVFTRAATPPSSAKFRLLEIVVLSRLRLSPQPPFGAVLTAGSDLSHCVCVRLFISSVCFVFLFVCLSSYIHIHSLINCTYIHTYIHKYIHACIHTYIHTFVCIDSYALSLNHTRVFLFIYSFHTHTFA